MSAHTAGPWNAVECETGSGWTVGPRRTDGVDYVADVHRLTSGRTDAESDANAHLIAAAPDLLKALRMARTWVAGFDHEDRARADLAVIDAAISKAEDGQ